AMIKLKNSIMLIMSLVIITGLAACGEGIQSNEGGSSKDNNSTNDTETGNIKVADLDIKFAWAMPEGTATSEQGNDIAKKIEEKSDETINVQTYPGGSLLEAGELDKGVSGNKVEMGSISLHECEGSIPATKIEMVPWLLPED